MRKSRFTEERMELLRRQSFSGLNPPAGIDPKRPDASAQSVEQVARLSRNVRQPDHLLAN
jgi:hypothetical protein